MLPTCLSAWLPAYIPACLPASMSHANLLIFWLHKVDLGVKSPMPINLNFGFNVINETPLML